MMFLSYDLFNWYLSALKVQYFLTSLLFRRFKKFENSITLSKALLSNLSICITLIYPFYGSMFLCFSRGAVFLQKKADQLLNAVSFFSALLVFSLSVEFIITRPGSQGNEALIFINFHSE